MGIENSQIRASCRRLPDTGTSDTIAVSDSLRRTPRRRAPAAGFRRESGGSDGRILHAHLVLPALRSFQSDGGRPRRSRHVRALQSDGPNPAEPGSGRRSGRSDSDAGSQARRAVTRQLLSGATAHSPTAQRRDPRAPWRPSRSPAKSRDHSNLTQVPAAPPANRFALSGAGQHRIRAGRPFAEPMQKNAGPVTPSLRNIPENARLEVFQSLDDGRGDAAGTPPLPRPRTPGRASCR